MATTITWAGGGGSPTIQPAASGGFNTCGFFGSSFGFSIRVGEYNQSTFRTNEAGTSDGGTLPNLRYANTSGAYVGGLSTPDELRNIEQYEATLRIRLDTDAPVGTQNSSFRAFDKVNINNNPSGVAIFAAEILKDPGTYGSGDVSWTQIYGSGSILSLDDHILAWQTGVQHDWYIGLTATPTSIGEKTDIGFYFETEFL